MGPFPFKYLEVLQSLKSQSVSTVPPFPLSAQYVKNISAAQAAAGEGQGEDEKHPPKKTQTKKGDDCSGSEWMYGSKRKEYISKHVEGGLNYQSAASKWDDSHEKAVYLSVVSVSELKRRRFLPAGAMESPWHKKIHGT